MKISYTKFVNEYDPISVSWEHDHNNILLELSEPMLIDEQAANDSYPRVGIKTKIAIFNMVRIIKTKDHHPIQFQSR